MVSSSRKEIVNDTQPILRLGDLYVSTDLGRNETFRPGFTDPVKTVIKEGTKIKK